MHPNLAIIAQNHLGASPKNRISLEGIIIFLEKISAKTPNPELLRSIPVAKELKEDCESKLQTYTKSLFVHILFQFWRESLSNVLNYEY
jgi:hypothetical protein